MTVIAKLSASFSLQVSGELIEMWEVFDDTETIDDAYTLDDTNTFDDTAGTEIFIAYLFDLTTDMADVDVTRIDANGNLLIANEFAEMWDVFDDTETIDDTYALDDTYSLDDADETDVFFAYLFDLTINSNNVDIFRIDVNGKFLAPAIIEGTI